MIFTSLYSFFARSCNLQDLSQPGTECWDLGNENAESHTLDCQGIPSHISFQEVQMFNPFHVSCLHDVIIFPTKKKLENRVILTSFSFLIYTVNPKRFLCLHNFKNKLIFFLPILLLSDLTGSTLCSFWPLVISPAYSL